MKLYYLLLVAGFILLSVASLFDVNYIHYEKPIPHDKWQTITFYDFNAFKKPGLTLDGVSEFAYIKTSRKVRIWANGNIEIVTLFHPSRSYVFAQDIRNADLLRHELYHFHIAEYCSRLFRKEVSENKQGVTNSTIDRLKDKYYKLEDEMQEQYDNDSYHSYVMQEQKKWEAKMDSLLLSLESFSNTITRYSN